MKFADEKSADGSSLLVASWVDGNGDAIGVSAHAISSTAVGKGWGHVSTCKGQYDTAVASDLAVSSKGEWVAVGSWGCPGAKAGAGNFVIFKGVGGTGIPDFQEAVAGQIWAVDVAVAADGTRYAAAGSWHTNDGAHPSQVSLYATPRGLP